MNYEQRLIELAEAHEAARNAKGAFTDKFTKGLDEAAKEYASGHKMSEVEALSDIGTRNGNLEWLRQEVFESCHEEWEAMKAARQRLGNIKGALMRSGQVSLKKKRAEEEEEQAKKSRPLHERYNLAA